MWKRRLLVTISVLTLLSALDVPASADVFQIYLHNLDGTPLVRDSSRPSVVQVFEQIPGQTVRVGSLTVNMEVPKSARALAVGADDGRGSVTLSVDFAGPKDTRALVFVAQRFDENVPTAVIPFVLESLNLGTQVLHITVPTAAAPAMAPSPCPPNSCCTPRRRLCFLRRR